LKGKETSPWDEDNPDTYIPDTGRNDPLTVVEDAMPEELRPPRSGDDEENEILSYFFSQFATEAVNMVMNNLQVYSMVQIGLEKRVTMGIPGMGAFTVSEGSQSGFGIGVQGYMVNVEFLVAKVSEDDITVIISGTPEGSDVTITKEAHYIPGSPSGAIDGGGGGGRGGRGGGGGGGRPRG
jgi:hypothetical protein